MAPVGVGMRIIGREVSLLAITDGETILILEPVQDHKQVGEGDTGPNTGGMGVYSPVATLTRRIQRQIEQRVLVPTIHALRREEIVQLVRNAFEVSWVAAARRSDYLGQLARYLARAA